MWKTLASLAILAHALPAQLCSYNPDNVPSNGGGNVIPFGSVSKTDTNWSNQRYQQLIPTSLLPAFPARIRDVAWAPAGTSVRDIDFLQITLGQTTSTTMSTTFATNLGPTAQVCLAAKNYIWPIKQDTWCRIGLQKPFLFLPSNGNLIVEVLVMGAGATTSSGGHGYRSITGMPRMYNRAWTPPNVPATGQLATSAGLRIEICFDTHDLSVYGAGCPGTNGTPALTLQGSSQLGKSFSIDLTNGKTVALLVLGLVGLSPVDLAPIGARGCSLYETPDIVFSVPTPNGTAQVNATVPLDNGLVGALLYAQWFPLDPTVNAAGISGSNYGRILMGN